MKLVKKIGITMSAAALFAAALHCSFSARLEDVSVQFSIGEHNDTTYPKMDVIAMEESLYSVRKRRFYPICGSLYEPAKPLSHR